MRVWASRSCDQGGRSGTAAMTRALRATVAVVVLTLSLTACANAGSAPLDATDSQPTSTVPDHPVTTGAAGTPVVTVRHGSTVLALPAYSACYDSMCADGMPPESPPHVDSPPEVEIDFPLPDWSFTATFKPAGEACGREQTVSVERTDPDTFSLRPVGHADTYDVMLFGRGDGDLATVFRWTTPTDGPLPEPDATLAVLADHNGEVDSYGVELTLSNLATTPRKATATITVTAADGDHLTFAATQSRQARHGCWPEGTIRWDGPDESGKLAARLGPSPFTYEVVLTLDGTRYTATADWPADVIQGNEPSVALTFTPPLPSPR